MKSLSRIGVIILLVVAQCAFSSSIVKRESSLEQQKKLLDSLNNFREKFALITQVGNMNELSYDMELEKQARNNYTCEVMKSLKSPTLYFPVNEQIMLDFLSFTVVRGFDEFSWYEAGDYFGSVIHPLHTKIGCVPLTEHCVKKPMYGVEKFTDLKEITLEGMCMLGPKRKYSKDDRIIGKPGSHCASGQTDNGLCKTNFF